VDVQVMNRIARQQFPQLMEDLDNEGAVLDLFLTKWFPVMFLGCVNERVGDRIIDLVVYKGFKIIFRITLGLLGILSDEIDVFDEERAKAESMDGKGAAEATAAAAAAAAGSPQQSASQSGGTTASSSSSSEPAGDKEEFESRIGFIMTTLQNLPKLLTEADLMERTFSFHVSKTEIADLRKAVRNEMKASTRVSSSSESPKLSKPLSSPESRVIPPPSLPAQATQPVASLVAASSPSQPVTISSSSQPAAASSQPTPPPSLPPEAIPVQVSPPSQPIPSPSTVNPPVSSSPPSSAEPSQHDSKLESPSRVIGLPPNLTVIPQTAEPLVFDPLPNSQV